jgi:hypothetical protein
MNYKNLNNWYTKLRQRKMNYTWPTGIKAEEDTVNYTWPTGIQSSGRGI